jgi:hypothetical protein
MKILEIHSQYIIEYQQNLLQICLKAGKVIKTTNECK